jgi:hypothetical protein
LAAKTPPDLIVHRLGAGELIQRLAQFGAPALVCFFPPRKTDDAKAGGHLLLFEKMVESGDELARRQIAARAENDDAARLAQAPLGANMADGSLRQDF